VSSDTVIFNLKRFWPPDAPRNRQVRLYEEIKTGRKTCEYRDDKKYWRRRLLGERCPSKAWFVEGYPKGNLPRLEADITKIVVNEV
jgi:hypothetical protein